MRLGKFQVDGDELFNKAVWTLIVSILGFSAKKFNDMSADIASLNIKMVTVVTTLTQYQDTVRDHEGRIRALERSR